MDCCMYRQRNVLLSAVSVPCILPHPKRFRGITPEGVDFPRLLGGRKLAEATQRLKRIPHIALDNIVVYTCMYMDL